MYNVINNAMQYEVFYYFCNFDMQEVAFCINTSKIKNIWWNIWGNATLFVCVIINKMREKIKEGLFQQYNPEEKKWLFLSGFSKEKKLLVSEWVVSSEKPLHELIDALYVWYIESKIEDILYVCCDVVTDLIEITDGAEIVTKSPEERGFAVVSKETGQSWVILPATSWVTDARSALFYLKKKYAVEGKAEVAVFRTNRIIIWK